MLIGKTVLNEEKIKELIVEIKKKKELKEISEEFVKEQLFNYLQQEQKAAKSLAVNFNPKAAVYRQIVKAVRGKLRRSYGLFRVGEESKKRREYLEELYQSQAGRLREESFKKVLSTNSSTKERLSFYPQLYEKIVKMIGNDDKPKTIVELGCGINPFSVYWMMSVLKSKQLSYYGFDLSEEEVAQINEFFQWWSKEAKKEGIVFSGTAEVLDLFHFGKLLTLKKADLCFLWKMTDVLDRGKGHKVSEAVIKAVPAKYVVVSFPTQTMSGKKMNFPRRKWLELMAVRLGYKYDILEFSNEIFYVLKKWIGI